MILLSSNIFVFQVGLSHPGYPTLGPHNIMQVLSSLKLDFSIFAMLNSDLAQLSCSISIALQFMSCSFELPPGDTTLAGTWTLPATRISHYEEITAASRAVLVKIGLSSLTRPLWLLWSMASNALYLFEQIQFPEQAPQTSTTLCYLELHCH